ncbi:ribosome-recycling factor [Vitis riparia]|uniref:ribosome-recycling factor n=1 Tax=Vitis riparia TaxID=96939 RepID=UPI00155A33D5|nr:ribosome-recycling factor [Vitis riparia]
MAISVRRAFSYRSILLLHCRHLSHIIHSPSLTGSPSLNPSASSALDFLRESRRGFAKGRKSKDSDAGNTVEVVPDIGPAVKENAMSQMDAAVVALSRELSKLRTGRASSGMLDHIIVETGGVKMPLSRLAVVSVLDPKTLSVTPYDPDALKQLENAIVSSPLGLNPKADGERLIAVIPPLTKEHIQAMCKVVAKSCEDVKQSIRRARQKALDTIKKAGSSLPKDVAKRLEKEVDELTKKFVKSAEDMCKAKEKEIAEG